MLSDNQALSVHVSWHFMFSILHEKSAMHFIEIQTHKCDFLKIPSTCKCPASIHLTTQKNGYYSSYQNNIIVIIKGYEEKVCEKQLPFSTYSKTVAINLSLLEFSYPHGKRITILHYFKGETGFDSGIGRM